MRGDVVEGMIVVSESSMLNDKNDTPEYSMVLCRRERDEGKWFYPNKYWDQEWDKSDKGYSTHLRIYDVIEAISPDEDSYLWNSKYDLTWREARKDLKNRYVQSQGRYFQPSRVHVGQESASPSMEEAKEEMVIPWRPYDGNCICGRCDQCRLNEEIKARSGFLWWMFGGTLVGIILAVLITISDGFNFADNLGVILLGWLIGSLVE